MYRFLVQPKWIAGFLACLLVMAAMVGLAQWQLNRLDSKRAVNSAITVARTAEVKPATAVLPKAAADNPKAADEWRRVSATGTYQVDKTILVRGRTLNSVVGFEIVVPLITNDGEMILIDRGFVPAPARADQLPAVPPAPAGVVTVTGSVRIPYQATESATNIVKIQGADTVRAIDNERLAKQLSITLRGGFVSALTETGGTAAGLTRIPLPVLDEGPHLSYAIQWFLFAGMVLFGFGYVAKKEAEARNPAQQLITAEPDL